MRQVTGIVVSLRVAPEGRISTQPRWRETDGGRKGRRRREQRSLSPVPVSLACDRSNTEIAPDAVGLGEQGCPASVDRDQAPVDSLERRLRVGCSGRRDKQCPGVIGWRWSAGALVVLGDAA